MDKYIKIRLGKNKYAVAREMAGGWFNVVTITTSETMASLTHDALQEFERTPGDRDAKAQPRTIREAR